MCKLYSIYITTHSYNYVYNVRVVKKTNHMVTINKYKIKFPKQVTAFGERLYRITWSSNPID